MALLRRNESKSEATQRLRDNQWHGGKGSHKHYYTLQDISQATGRAIGTVRNDVSSGRLVMEDLVNVASYVWLMRGAGRGCSIMESRYHRARGAGVTRSSVGCICMYSTLTPSQKKRGGLSST